MSDINSFFSINNTVRDLTATDLGQVTNYIDVIEAFSRTTNQSIYVIDYEKKGFEYVSSNPLFLNGHSSEEVVEMGYDFYFKYVPAEDLELLLKINQVGFDFYERIPLVDRKQYSISYDFHLNTNEHKTILVHQKLTPIFLTEKGQVWKSICMVSLSSRQNSGNIIVDRSGHNESHEYDLSADCWRKLEKITLSEREKEILQYSIRGYSITEVAERIFVSPDTVKFHRKKMFEKLDVGNISEAISFATLNKLI